MIMPLVSVIIPVYNAREFIGKSIESVMYQNIDVELIIVEDSSEDSCKDIVDKYTEQCKIVYVRNEINLGVAKSRNIGIKLAKGKFIAFLDADDWWANDKSQKQLQIVDSHNVDLVYTGRELVYESGQAMNKVINVPEYVDYKTLLKGNIIPCASVLMKSEIAKKYLQHNDELHEDYIMWLEILRDGYVARGINEPLLISRMSANGKSRNKLKSAKMTWGVYKLMGIGIFKRVYYFVNYSLQGFRKYK